MSGEEYTQAKQDTLQSVRSRMLMWHEHTFKEGDLAEQLELSVLSIAAVTRNRHCMSYCCTLCPDRPVHFVYDYSQDLLAPQTGGRVGLLDVRQFRQCLRKAFLRCDMLTLHHVAGVFGSFLISADEHTPRMPGGRLTTDTPAVRCRRRHVVHSHDQHLHGPTGLAARGRRQLVLAVYRMRHGRASRVERRNMQHSKAMSSLSQMSAELLRRVRAWNQSGSDPVPT